MFKILGHLPNIWSAKDPRLLWRTGKTDQTKPMCKTIFAGYGCLKVHFLMSWLIILRRNKKPVHQTILLIWSPI